MGGKDSETWLTINQKGKEMADYPQLGIGLPKNNQHYAPPETCDAAARAPEIIETMTGLYQATSHSFDLACKLRERLGTVLRPNSPAVNGTTACSTPRATELGASIASRADNVGETNSVLMDILARLEL